MASALTGKTPEYGLHLEENRRATHIIEVNFEPKGEDYPIIGLIVGEKVNGIPYLRFFGDNDDLKLMGAAMAASGSIAMYHVEGITPEFRNALGDDVERIVIEKEEVDSRKISIDVELVAIGCPHASLKELIRIAEFVRGKRKQKDVELWIFTAKSTAERGKEYVKIIEEFGGKVMVDTCVVVSNAGKIFKRIGTTSGKAAFYLSKKKFGGATVEIADIYTLLRSVIE